MRETEFTDRPQADGLILQADGASAIVVPDAALLFGAEFLRAGPDLILSNADRPDVRIVDYFDTATPPDLTVPNGATLTGALVVRLAGPEAPGAYAQAGAIRGGDAIGQVETLMGAASVQRADGTVEDLAVGARIYPNDVVTTAAASTCALTFVDGTIFTLASASRMVIDELIYDPEGTDNTATFNLVEGGFVFIAGQVAKTGGMDVTTPAATMGIRGTKVRVDISLEGGIARVEVSLEVEADGSWGEIALIDLFGNPIATIDTTDTTWVVTPSEPASEVARVPPGLDAQAALTIVEVASAAARARVDAGEPYVPAGQSSALQAPAEEAPEGEPLEPRQDDTLEAVPPTGPEPDAPTAPPPPVNGGSEDLDEAPRNDARPPPVAPDDARLIDEDGSVTAHLDPGASGGETISFSLVAAPRFGQVVLAETGLYRYMPDPDYAGSDSFTYSVTDPRGATDTGTVTIEVAPVNDAPVLDDAAARVAEDGTVTVTLSGRDVEDDAAGAPLGYALAGGAAHGSVTAGAAPGTFVYTPDPDHAGPDAFTVVATDADGAASAPATVTIEVAPVNDAPVAQDVTATGVEDSTIAVTLVARDVENDPISYRIEAGPARGVVVPGSVAGTFLYTPDADYNGTDSFTYVAIDDGGAESAVRTATVTVQPVNDAPVPEDVVVKTGAGASVTGKVTAADPDLGDLLRFSKGSDPSNGVVSVADDGSFDYTPARGFSGFDSFTVEVIDVDSDGQARSETPVTATVTVAVGAAGYVDAEGRDLSIVVDTDGAGGLPSGNVGVFTEAPGSATLNLVIVLDRSGSISTTEWSETIDAINGALQSLFDKFDGSRTDVNVQVITYSSRTSVLRPDGFYGLQTEFGALTGAIAELKSVRPSGGTNFKDAFAATESQLVMQGADEKAFVFFLTDGEPSVAFIGKDISDWESTTLASLKQSIPDLTIEAFGIGEDADLGLLSTRVDSGGEAVAVETPDDLVAAFGASALFAASLVSFSLRLLADGEDRGEIATEGDTDAFSLLGVDDYVLTLANVDGIADLLGETNVLQAEAVFDVDGPDGDGDRVTLVETGSLGVGLEAVDRTGTDGADVLFGSMQDDTLDGGQGDDLLVAGAGDDVLAGGAGVDVLLAGAGDDRLEAGMAEPGERFDGGAGRDVLALDNGDLLPSPDVAGIEAFDLENGNADTVTLTLADVLSFSDEGDTDLEALLGRSLPESATIHGEAGDAITLVGADDAVVETVIDGARTLDVYEFSDGAGDVLATLAIDQDVTVTVAAASGA